VDLPDILIQALPQMIELREARDIDGNKKMTVRAG
jgi:hypothetical protein